MTNRATTDTTSGVMIDAPDTLDRDDAVWVRRDDTGYTAWVHIAQLAPLVPADGDIDLRARQRVHTQYRATRTIPMLPARIEHHASLRPGDPQASMRVTMRYTHDGTLTGHELADATLTDAHSVTYADTPAILDDPNHPLNPVLRDAHALTTTLLERRKQSGALALYDLFKGYATNEEGQLVKLAGHQRNVGYVIVSELMIAANAAIATWCAEHDLPILFRNHRIAAVAGDRQDILDELTTAHTVSEATHYETLRTRMSIVNRAATYDPAIFGHFGLNLPAYAHCTSPLRRYSDLINQRILMSALSDKPTPHALPALGDIATHINDTIRAERVARSEHFKQAARHDVQRRLGADDLTAFTSAELHRAIRIATEQDQPAPPPLAAEIRRRLDDNTLPLRDWYEILLNAPHTWTNLREHVNTALSSQPHSAPTLLNMHAQAVLGGPVTGDHLRWTITHAGTPQHPRFEARLTLQLDDTVESPPRTHRTKKDAKAHAALALLARLAGVPDTSHDLPPGAVAAAQHGTLEPIPADRNDVMAVNEYAQIGAVSGLEWTFSSEGPPHEPVFTCRATVDARSGTHTGIGTGASKQLAKAAAAQQLRHLIESELTRDSVSTP
ncbi:RNB domain-containing ribonuclease [Stackebrandtia soli]|uniref:RNB domain-containing ribonuclease n=1 Tax=Stackebrandtia soli TaxID=1892856 RepID=UPI0039EA69B6